MDESGTPRQDAAMADLGTPTIAIVAGEASGDLLGAGLMRAIVERCPGARFEGIGGPHMLAEGFESHYPMERLSVMGLIEVVGRLPELLKIRSGLKRRYVARKPDVFVGIDAPDFNLDLELALRKAGVRTVHYVSPTVWAWRPERVHKIARAVDLVLALFPFEAGFYRHHRVPVKFVGHPLADRLEPVIERSFARAELGLKAGAETVALLPGSRLGEVSRIGGPMLGAARWLVRRRPDLQFVAPMANAGVRAAFEAEVQRFAGPPVHLVDGQAHMAMAAADVVLTASGTATLETMLVGRPMVITYRTNWLTAQIARRMLRIRHAGLPNLLADRALCPELMQEQARPELLGAAVLRLLRRPQEREGLAKHFSRIAADLRKDADRRAAQGILGVLAGRPA